MRQVGEIGRDGGNLICLGVDKGKVHTFSRTRKVLIAISCAIDQRPIMTTTVALERLAKRRYESMTDYFTKLNLKFGEPLYT